MYTISWRVWSGLMFSNGLVLCTCTSHIGQYLLLCRYFTMQLRQTETHSLNTGCMHMRGLVLTRVKALDYGGRVDQVARAQRAHQTGVQIGDAQPTGLQHVAGRHHFTSGQDIRMSLILPTYPTPRHDLLKASICTRSARTLPATRRFAPVSVLPCCWFGSPRRRSFSLLGIVPCLCFITPLLTDTAR